ncbi:aminotransferase class III-fold pyridoxal phosphate-dependent enzyme [Streptomyces sp. M19]
MTANATNGTARTDGTARRALDATRRHLSPQLALVYGMNGSGAIEMSGEGARLRLSDGRGALDFGSYAVTLLGQRHRRRGRGAPRAGRDARLQPGPGQPGDRGPRRGAGGLGRPGRLTKVWLGLNGSDAVEAALKLARRATGRQRVVAVEGAYHGKSLGALAATWNARYRTALEPLLGGVTHIPRRSRRSPAPSRTATWPRSSSNPSRARAASGRWTRLPARPGGRGARERRLRDRRRDPDRAAPLRAPAGQHRGRHGARRRPARQGPRRRRAAGVRRRGDAGAVRAAGGRPVRAHHHLLRASAGRRRRCRGARRGGGTRPRGERLARAFGSGLARLAERHPARHRGTRPGAAVGHGVRHLRRGRGGPDGAGQAGPGGLPAWAARRCCGCCRRWSPRTRTSRRRWNCWTPSARRCPRSSGPRPGRRPEPCPRPYPRRCAPLRASASALPRFRP